MSGINEQDKKDIIEGIVAKLSNGSFKKDITDRLDTLKDKFDEHKLHADVMFDKVLTKVNKHEKNFRVLSPFVIYFGLASHTKRWVRSAFWLSLIVLFILFNTINWKALGYHGFKKIVGTGIETFIDK